MRKIPKKKYRELDNLSKFYKSLENKGIHIDDELGSHSIVNLAKLVWKLNQNKDDKIY